MSAVIRRRLFTISAIRFGEMPIALASWFCDSRYSARNSSFSISPGVTGANSSVAEVFLVVVNELDLLGVAVAPFENHAPPIVHSDRVEVFQIAL